MYLLISDLFFLMIRRPTRSTRTDTRFPYTTHFRSVLASKGFRTGNTNLVSPIDPFTGAALPQSFKPDTLWNYEIGTKVALLDNRLNINATAFYIDWSKIQLQVRTASGLPYTANAGTARSKGAELEIVARPASAFELGTSLAYTDAKLKSVVAGVPAARSEE